MANDMAAFLARSNDPEHTETTFVCGCPVNTGNWTRAPSPMPPTATRSVSGATCIVISGREAATPRSKHRQLFGFAGSGSGLGRYERAETPDEIRPPPHEVLAILVSSVLLRQGEFAPDPLVDAD